MARKPRVSHAAGYKPKKLRVTVEVARSINPTSGTATFSACAFVAGSAHLYGRGAARRGGSGAAHRCAYGRNPRIATAAALRQIASTVQSRKGTFAGLAGYSKTNRKSRRVRRRSKRY